jgi:microcystin-dependent protein
MGAVLAYALPTIPAGWLLCDGSPVDAQAYPDLHAVMATTPDLRDQFIRGGAAADLTPKGAASVTLAEANLPPHAHGIDHDHPATAVTGPGTHTHGADFNTADSATLGTPSAIKGGSSNGTTAKPIRSVTGGDHSHTVDIPAFSGASSQTGGGQAFSVLPPHVVLAYIIKAVN